MMREIARIGEIACAQPTNIFGYEIWTHHSYAGGGARETASALVRCRHHYIVELAALLLAAVFPLPSML
jgi:hypothetical protein